MPCSDCKTQYCKCLVCPSCSSKDVRQLKCKAGDLKVCRECGKSWGYKKNFKIQTYQSRGSGNKDKLVL